MKNFLLIIIYIFFYGIVLSQNRLHEGDFEGGASVWGCPHYDDINYRFNHWKTEFSNMALYKKRPFAIKIWQSAGSNSQEPPCPCGAYHSPDYRGAVNNPQGYYIGILQYELIQQKLEGSDKLEEGKFYKVSCKINVPEFFNGDNHVTENSERYIIFFLAKNRVHYKRQGREFSGNSDGENICNATNLGFGFIHPYNSKYKEYDTNDTILIKKIRLNDFSYNTWYDVSFAFKMPEEGLNKHNWFVIDCTDDGSCGDYFCTNYTYIDDIVLEETDHCNTENPCSPTDGNITPNWIRWVDSENYSDLVIDGLENVFQATNIKIHDIPGVELINLPDKYCPSGIDYVHWDGKSSVGGVLAAGSYIWEMDLKNDCEEKHLTWPFSYLSPNNYYPSAGDNFVCNQSIIQPILCCEAEPNILIENETIEGAGEVLFHAVNNITIINTLIKSSAKDVTLKAGNNIILEPGFETEDGANVEMSIEPCESKQNQPKDSLADKKTENKILNEQFLTKSEDISVESENNSQFQDTFNIYPNPADNYIEISVNVNCSKNNEILKISISGISGKMYYNKQFNTVDNYFFGKINISNYPSGIYFITVTGNQFSETKKMIVK